MINKIEKKIVLLCKQTYVKFKMIKQPVHSLILRLLLRKDVRKNTKKYWDCQSNAF